MAWFFTEAGAGAEVGIPATLDSDDNKGGHAVLLKLQGIGIDKRNTEDGRHFTGLPKVPLK